MAVDLESKRLTMTEVAKRCGVHATSCWRWAVNGVRGVRLNVTKVGGRTYVTEDDLQDFLDAINSSDDDPPTQSAEARKRARAAKKRAEKLGL